ncbi:MAG: FCD domain-containing protein [Pseudomonadota bacterium]
MEHKFEPLKKEPAYLKVYNVVEAEILSGALKEGVALPTEADLCDQFGLTRATVREGLRLLEQADLVERGAAKRFYVKRPDTEDVAASTSKSLALGGVTFHEVWETLYTMYPSAMALATRRMSGERLSQIRDKHNAFREAETADPGDVVDAAVEFFQLIAGALENRVLLALLQSLNLLIGASLRQVIGKTPKARDRILKAQSRIIDALESKDEQQASHWMAKHIDDLKRGYAVAEVDINRKIL